MKRLAAVLVVLSFFLVGLVGCEQPKGKDTKTSGGTASSGTGTTGGTSATPASTDEK